MQTKILRLFLILIAAFCFSNTTFALDKGGPALFVQKSIQPGIGIGSHHHTDITIKNMTDYDIYIRVPVLDYYDVLHPTYTRHIYSKDAEYKRIILVDHHGRVFFNDYVSHHEILTIDY